VLQFTPLDRTALWRVNYLSAESYTVGAGADEGWQMKPKHVRLISGFRFYCFVNFGDSFEDRTQTHVVPSRVLEAALHQHL
jgi:hypothetical protein